MGWSCSHSMRIFSKALISRLSPSSSSLPSLDSTSVVTSCLAGVRASFTKYKKRKQSQLHYVMSSTFYFKFSPCKYIYKSCFGRCKGILSTDSLLCTQWIAKRWSRQSQLWQDIFILRDITPRYWPHPFLGGRGVCLGWSQALLCAPHHELYCNICIFLYLLLYTCTLHVILLWCNDGSFVQFR